MVIPERGLIWCPNAKVGTTTMVGVLPRLIASNASARPQTRRLVEGSLVHHGWRGLLVEPMPNPP